MFETHERFSLHETYSRTSETAVLSVGIDDVFIFAVNSGENYMLLQKYHNVQGGSHAQLEFRWKLFTTHIPERPHDYSSCSMYTVHVGNTLVILRLQL